jgi:hypothetical protein
MKIKIGNLWDSKDDLIFVTTNSYIRNDGALVMGRGAALECKTRYPGIEYDFGNMISRLHKVGPISNPSEKYGILVHETLPIGIFQVKYHFRDVADTNLILYSTQLLNELSKTKTISINFPGIGFGQLDEMQVLPIISQLSDNVTIYRFRR